MEKFHIIWITLIYFHKVNDKLIEINAYSMCNITYAEAVAILNIQEKNFLIKLQRKSVPGAWSPKPNQSIPLKYAHRTEYSPECKRRERRLIKHSSERSQKTRSPTIHWKKPAHSTPKNSLASSADSGFSQPAIPNRTKIVNIPTVHIPVKARDLLLGPSRRGWRMIPMVDSWFSQNRRELFYKNNRIQMKVMVSNLERELSFKILNRIVWQTDTVSKITIQ